MKNSVLLSFVPAWCLCILFFGSCAETNSADDEFINSLDGRWNCEYDLFLGKREKPSTPQSIVIRYPSISFLSNDTVVDYGWYRLENYKNPNVQGARVIKYYSYQGTRVRNGFLDSIVHEWYYNLVFDSDTLLLDGHLGFSRTSR